MKILVIGGAGYIGSHCCKALAAAGHETVVFDNLSTGHRGAVRWGPLIEGDIRDRAALEAVLAAHRPDQVMHFAALAYVGDSVLDPAPYYEVNVCGTLNLLQAMHAAGTGRLVFSSTCATYGTPQAMPIREETPQEPVNPYGRTKLMAERMFADFAAAYGLEWTALRYFNSAGADPDGELGEEHDPETHAMPLAIRAAQDDGSTFTIFGRDFDTPDGTCLRDYVHVSDLAAAHRLAAERLAAGGRSIALNLGTGRGTSVLELIETVGEVLGRPVPTCNGERRVGDPPELYADASKAQHALGWEAQYDLADMVRHAADWFARRGKSFDKLQAA